MLAAAEREAAVHYATAAPEELPLATASIDVAFLSVWSASLPAGEPLHEQVDVFVFRR